jgi:hypothetical protein
MRSISSVPIALSLLALCFGCNDHAAERTGASVQPESHPASSAAAVDPAAVAAPAAPAHGGSAGPQYQWGAGPAAAAGAAGTEAPGAGAPEAAGAGGTVRETMNAGGYTYMRLDTTAGPRWVATTEMPVAVGDQVVVTGGNEMPGFHSPTLNRTFEQITFAGSVAVVGGAGAHPAAGPAMPGAMPAGHPGAPTGALPPGHPSYDPAAMPAGHPAVQPGATEHQGAGTGTAGPLPAGATARPLPPGHPPI